MIIIKPFELDDNDWCHNCVQKSFKQHKKMWIWKYNVHNKIILQTLTYH